MRAWLRRNAACVELGWKFFLDLEFHEGSGRPIDVALA